MNQQNIESVIENPLNYFPTLQISNLTDVIKRMQFDNFSGNRAQTVKEIKNYIRIPKTVEWTIQLSNSSTAPTKRRVSQALRVETMIALSTILFFNVFGCLFLKISKRQALAINPARKIALNAVLSFSIIGLIFLGIKGFQLWESTKYHSGLLPTRSNEQDLCHDKANVQRSGQYQIELRALRLMQYYTLIYDFVCVNMPGGRWLDGLQAFIEKYPFLLKDERVFTPDEFEVKLQEESFVKQYRQFVECGLRSEGLRWVE
jgi:hypothetical protein